MKSFNQLFAEICLKAVEKPADSQTTKWLEAGIHSIGKKIVEEAAEVWMAAEHEGKARTAEEISQLIYHIQLMMVACGVTLEDLESNL